MIDCKLTKAETVALWHAVDALAWQVRVMKDITPPMDAESMDSERKRLTTAKRALRKVNALRSAFADNGDGNG